MKTKFTITTCPQKGRRMNLAPESDIPEAVKAETAAAKKTERLRKRGRVLSVWGVVFVGVPFLLPLVFFVHGAFSGHPLPVLLYPYLVLEFYLLSGIGGLLLYIASRSANVLRKPIGWTTLSIALLPMAASILFGNPLNRFDSRNLNRPVDAVILTALLVTLLCMVALCVFSILLIRRVFPRKPKPGATV